MEAIILPPLILFIVIVAPTWLVLHYRSKKQLNQGLSQDEYIQLSELSEVADNMSERIKALEAILDVETPDWRSKL